MLDLLGILKLIRITRLPRLIARLNMSEEKKAVFRVAQVSFFLILYIHLVCCTWWFAMKFDDKTWIPPMDLGTLATDVSNLINNSVDLCYE
jgi:hypothetical protein